MKSAISIKNAQKTFGTNGKRFVALSDLSLSVQCGEVFGFLGPNGAGKSTTIKILLNFLTPDRGQFSIFDKKVGTEEFRNHIGYLPEFPFFYDHLTAKETLTLSGRLSGISRHNLKRTIPDLLERVNLTQASNKRVREFSKGMKQRLGMANALIHDPDLLIFDEPMSGLDPVGRYQVKELISHLRQQGKTVFFSSHILGDIEELCDRIGIIHKGKLLYAGQVNDLLNPADRLESRFVTMVKEADNAGNA